MYKFLGASAYTPHLGCKMIPFLLLKTVTFYSLEIKVNDCSLYEHQLDLLSNDSTTVNFNAI